MQVVARDLKFVGDDYRNEKGSALRLCIQVQYLFFIN